MLPLVKGRVDVNMAIEGTPSLAFSGKTSTPVVLFDGVCGLCNRYVQFIIRRDLGSRFRFATLQGDFGQAALARHGYAAEGKVAPDSIVLVENPGTSNERLRFRSDAVLFVVAGLGGAWAALLILRIIPGALRDLVYDGVARVRHRVFGRTDACRLPSVEERHRFVE